MGNAVRRHPPRIVFAFASVIAASVFVLIAYAFFPNTKLESLGSSASKGSPALPASMKRSVEIVDASAKEAYEQNVAPPEKPVAPRATKHQLEGNAANAVRTTNANGILTQAVGAFEDQGYTIAFVIHDIKTGHEITYNSKEELYPASSIKAPFTCSVYQQLVETGKVRLNAVEPTAAITILESSDEGYRTLHRNYGEQHFIQWLKDAGVGPGSYGSYESMVSWNYPHICADQFALMWIHIYDYLTTETEPAKQLAGFLEKREVSALRDALGTDLRTWSKMGWFESSSAYRSEPATVEGGVVFSEDGPYVLAVITTAPAHISDLVPIHQALYRAHQDMA